MEDKDLARGLQGLRARIVSTTRSASGTVVHVVQLPSGEKYAMFHADVMELAAGVTTIQDILVRNDRADLGDEWPTPNEEAAAAAGGAGQTAAGHLPEDFKVVQAEAWDTSLGLFASMVSDYEALGEPPAQQTSGRPRSPGVRRIKGT